MFVSSYVPRAPAVNPHCLAPASTLSQSSALVRNLVLYRSLQEQEQAAIPARIGKLQGEIDEQLEREAKLQTRYANLTRRLRELKV